jgi:putative ATPase
MQDLFPEELEKPAAPDAPLATRMRPRTLDEVVGQRHILGPGKLLRRAIQADRISSIILYGPPGVGKTSLAYVIAASTQSRFERLSGVEGSVADIRRVVAQAANRLQNTRQKTILFIDEIHRFNKAQQDVLLPDVESGLLRLIGATTHNPFFYVNSPLVSRSQIFQLEPLLIEDLLTLIRQALTDKERGLGELRLRVDDEAAAHLAKVSDGDARKCLNALEIAARYWLAKMLYAGEDIRFIARRLIICASEDVGMADSNALAVTVAAQQAVEFVGLPEAQLVLAHATVYVATAPKSNRCTVAIGKAAAEVREGRTLAIPQHLRDAHYKAAKKLGHGEGYKYSHDYEGAYVPQAYLPEGRIYYEPSENGMEKRVKERLDYWRKLFDEDQKRAAEKSKSEK